MPADLICLLFHIAYLSIQIELGSASLSSRVFPSIKVEALDFTYLGRVLIEKVYLSLVRLCVTYALIKENPWQCQRKTREAFDEMMSFLAASRRSDGADNLSCCEANKNQQNKKNSATPQHRVIKSFLVIFSKM